jgi:hypothetical protein
MSFFPLVKMSVFEKRLSSTSEKVEVGFINFLASSMNVVLFCLSFLGTLVLIAGAISSLILLYIVAKDQYLVLMNIFLPLIKINGTFLNVALNVAAISILGVLIAKAHNKFQRRRR